MTMVEQGEGDVLTLLHQYNLRSTTTHRDALIRALGAEIPYPGREKLGEYINRRLLELGVDENRLLSSGSVYRIMAYGGNVNPTPEQRKTTGERRSVRRPRRPQDARVVASNASSARIRAADAQHQYTSMLNAPARKLNMPLIRSAEQVQHLLVELTALDPEVAVTQIPIERCRQWTPEHAEWWLKFTQLCEQRRRAETPDVPPMRYPKRTKLVKSETPKEEYQLSPVQASVLAWMRARKPSTWTVLTLSEGTGSSPAAVVTAVERLAQIGLVQKHDDGVSLA